MKTKNLLGILSISILAALSLSGCETNRNNTNNDSTDSLVNGGGDSDSGSGDSGSGDSGNETPQVSTYTITFESNGGSSVGSISVDSNTTLTNLETPTKDGYIFDGWYTNASLSTMFDTTSKITANMTLYAKWTEIKPGDLIKSVSGYNEGLYATFTESNSMSSAIKVEVKKSSEQSYTKVDNSLIRENDSNSARVDVLGLSEGSYDLKITSSNGTTAEKKNISVTSYDRSGYAHFKTTNDGTSVNVDDGIGAYKNDGTLKDNTVVVYVSEANKNTVEATIAGKTCKGIVAILQKQASSSYPLDIRIIGQISAATWKQIDYKTSTNVGNTTWTMNGSYYNFDIKNNDGTSLSTSGKITQDKLIEEGYNTLDTSKYSVLNGLSSYMTCGTTVKNNVTMNDFDSCWNNCSVSSAKNITVEGVGEDATIFQWGITFDKCSSVEVRNITFDDYTEDACAFQGKNDSTTIAGFTDGHNWVHNNTFNKGINYWDVTYEQDKHEGDGATDLKKTAFITLSYNHYYNCHKTGLVGGSSTQHTASITYHHNYYDNCQSRLPFGRQANMHMYNNYYSASTGNNMQIYAGAFAFIENSYFENCKKTFILTEDKTGQTPAIKSYNNEFISCKNHDGATVVTSREQTVTNGNIYNQTFDTSTIDFYYDSINKKSNVTYMTNATTAKNDCIKFAGAGIISKK